MLETELKKKPSIEHLAWAIEQRKEVQLTMLALYQFVQTHKAEHLTIEYLSFTAMHRKQSVKYLS